MNGYTRGLDGSGISDNQEVPRVVLGRSRRTRDGHSRHEHPTPAAPASRDHHGHRGQHDDGARTAPGPAGVRGPLPAARCLRGLWYLPLCRGLPIRHRYPTRHPCRGHPQVRHSRWGEGRRELPPPTAGSPRTAHAPPASGPPSLATCPFTTSIRPGPLPTRSSINLDLAVSGGRRWRRRTPRRERVRSWRGAGPWAPRRPAAPSRKSGSIDLQPHAATIIRSRGCYEPYSAVTAPLAAHCAPRARNLR